MAIQNWIPMRTDLRYDPSVGKIAVMMKERVEVVIGYLHSVWCWADVATEDGVISGITLDKAEEMLAMPHFLHYMHDVGWLDYIETTKSCQIVFPNWDNWMSKCSRKRLKDAKRKELDRTDKTRTKSGQMSEEKRTLCSSSSSSSSSKPKKSSVFQKPSEEDVTAYFQEKGFTSDPMGFVDHYESNGWRVGRNPMKDWHRAANGWERRQAEFASSKSKTGEITFDHLFEDQQ